MSSWETARIWSYNSVRRSLFLGIWVICLLPQELITLEPGKPIERKLSGGQIHIYQIGQAALTEGRFLKVVVRQTGREVLVNLLGPDGKQITELDPEIGKQGKRTITYVTEVGGSYRLNVQAAQKDAPAENYEIQLVDLREATKEDRELQEACKLSAEFLRLFRAGKYDEALSFAERALEKRKKILGLDHYLVAVSLNRLAIIYSIKGDYAKVEPLYQSALEILEKVLEPEHPRIADVFNNLAALYYNKGDYDKALLFYQRALVMRERLLGPEHSDVAQALNNLAIVYKEIGEYEKAEPLYQRALKIREKTFGPDAPEVVFPISNLAVNYTLKGEYDKAEPLYQRAIGIWEKTFGPHYSNLAFPLDGLANLYYLRGEYEKATPMHLRALEIKEKTLGRYHPEVALSLNKLAALFAAKGDQSQAITFQSRANAISERNLTLNLVTGSERQKLAYLATLSKQTNQILSLHLQYAPQDPTARSLAANAVLQRKGRALDAMSDSFATLRQHSNPNDRVLLDKLKDTITQLASLVLNGPQKMSPDDHQKQIKALEEQKEKLESEVSLHSAEFQAQSQPITIASVQSTIPADGALIEFASYHPFIAKARQNEKVYGESRYVAYIFRRQGEIQWKELGEAKAIDNAIAALREALRDPKRQDVKELARAVDEKVMRPIRTMLGEATQLFISPDGALNLVPFAALIDEKGRYLVERYSFTYLTSGRDLLRLQIARDSRSAPQIVADPTFGEPEVYNLAKAYGPKNTTPPRARTRQSVTTGNDLSSVYFSPLRGTALEAIAIKTLFPDAMLLTRERATEAALKQVVAPRILHIATHGFFLEDQRVKIEGTYSSDSPGELRGLTANVKIENPLLRSGLALAGANLRRADADDGILSALEAAGLNLWGTKLVVLSACDTGVGEVRTGDGVYGLRRALVLAGAETLVMSLWPVRDFVTRELMTLYYDGLRQGQGRGIALRQMQLKMLQRPGRQHPFYWASFIQSGEWANLDGKR